MDQLHDGGERHRPRVLRAGRPMAEQQQGGAEQLPLHPQQMFVDEGDDGKVRGDDAAELLGYELQLARHGPLDISERNGGELLAHVISPWRAPWTARRRL